MKNLFTIDEYGNTLRRKRQTEGAVLKFHNERHSVRGGDLKAPLTLAVPAKLRQQYSQLTYWEILFVNEFYKGKPRPSGKTRFSAIRNDIEKEWQRLSSLDKSEFYIDVEDNPELDRRIKNEINTQLNNNQQTEIIHESIEKARIEKAKRYSLALYEEYRHIVKLLSSSSYEPAFKVLMLSETLSKNYQKLSLNDEIIVKKRERHKTIASHLTFDEDILNTIYSEVHKAINFSQLYFMGVEKSNESLDSKSETSVEKLETFGKGHWIKFEGKQKCPEEYIKNAQALTILVQDTIWCTKMFALYHLEECDYYIFVDHKNQPHIAVKIKNDKIEEIRGIFNDKGEELEHEFRDVAIEFLKNNPHLQDAKQWLKKEICNARLCKYKEEIISGTFKEEDVPRLMEDLFNLEGDFKNHSEYDNSNLTELIKVLPKISKQIAAYFNCKEEEIAFGDVDFKNMTSQPYKIILGNANFEGSAIESLANLKLIRGNANFYNSKVTDLGLLETIYGDANFENSILNSLNLLHTIYGNAWLQNSKITDLGDLYYIGKSVNFENSLIESLKNLHIIGNTASFSYSRITHLSKLQTIGGKIYSSKCPINVNDYFTLQNGKYVRDEAEQVL